MRINAYKRRPAFSFTVIISAKNNFLVLVKPFITTALEYRAVLRLQKQFVCVATYFLVMSPYLRDFFDVIVYLIIMVITIV